MKTLDRYIIFSILKTAFVATLVFSFILVGVELFQKMDSILTGGVPFLSVAFYAFLCLPEYFIMVFSISLLFANTYFQSSLSANNERIALLNAGINKWRILRPILFLAIVLTLITFCVNESSFKELETVRTRTSEELFGSSSTQDTRNIVIREDGGYIVYTSRFIESENRLVSPVIVRERDGEFYSRITAESGVYSDGCWTLENVTVYSKDEEGSVRTEKISSLKLEDLNIEPDYFKATNINIETMSIKRAFEYLGTLKVQQKDTWQEKCTDYLRVLFKPISILLLLCISSLFDYNLKKNVLLFSIIESLSVAVVYYVSDMVFSIFAHQGAFPPFMVVLLPILSTIVIAFGINAFGKRV